MRKERNNFFSESGFNNQGYYYNQFPNPMNNQFNNQMEASSSFYMNQGMNQTSDYQTRISRLERQVNRLESRVTKLENNMSISSTNEDIIDKNNTMYML